MTTAIILTICALLLLSYSFDISFAKTKIPSVILLLVLGWVVHVACDSFSIVLPDLQPVLPALGTIGLILIVLDGAMDLEYDSTKASLIRRSFLSALLPIILLNGALAFAFGLVVDAPVKTILLCTVPLSIISSAIAIPSARNLTRSDKEFVVYESSFSDILGILAFNFLAINESVTAASFGAFIIELVVMLLIAVISTAGLSFILAKNNHHVKFAPIILLIIVIYYLSKLLNLPGLIFILIFGLVLGNLETLRKLDFAKYFPFDRLEPEVVKFRDIITEATFLVRSLFFLMFGFLIDTGALLDPESLLWSAIVVCIIFAVRAAVLRLIGMKLSPLLSLAPRGLITILLFISIPGGAMIPIVSRSMIIQVIVMTALVMMAGLVRSGKPSPKNTLNLENAAAAAGLQKESPNG